MGGTKINEPLKESMYAELTEGFPRYIYLLTDGKVEDPNLVI